MVATPTKTIETGYSPRWFQREIHDKLKRFSVLVLHRRAGKTVLAINQLIHSALTCKKPDGRFAYVAPYQKQAKQIAWDYLKKFTRKIPNTKINEVELSIDLPGGNRIRLYGADNPDALRGIYLDGVVLDEVADMRPEMWGEVIRPALTDRKGWCLFIGTPKGMNMFYDLYCKAQTDPEWYAGCYRADETNAIDPAELKLAKETMSENQYRQEMLCDFSASTDNTLISIDMVTEASGRFTREDMLEGLPKIIGVDVARFGGDRSVIQRRWGYAALEPIVMQGLDNMEVVGRITNVIQQWKPDAIFVDAGRGEGVIDRLRQLGHTVIEVNFGGKPGKPNFANKRAEMWSDMADWIRDRGVLPNHSELKTDLCVPMYSFDASNKMVLESKEKIKERGARSPDIADALALTFAMPVSPKIAGVGAIRYSTGGAVKSDYDPFSVA